MGWSLGTNDAANIFGTAVSSYMVKYRTAVIITAVFVIAGAILQGSRGIETLSGITSQTENTAFIVSIAAAISVTMMTYLKLPVSTSQAVMGALLGIGIINRQIDLQSLYKVLICWATTPVGAAIVAIILYQILSSVIRKIPIHFLTYDRIMRYLLIVAGAYGAFSLGANNVANVTGAFYEAGTLGMNQALLIGGTSIALGALTYSRNVMFTVGKKIITMDAFSAFIVVFSHSIVMHIYAIIGVPVSSSQAIVGAALGVGITKQIRTVSRTNISAIFSGWLLTPVFGMLISLILYHILI